MNARQVGAVVVCASVEFLLYYRKNRRTSVGVTPFTRNNWSINQAVLPKPDPAPVGDNRMRRESKTPA